MLTGRIFCRSRPPIAITGSDRCLCFVDAEITKWVDTKWFESCCGKKTAAAKRLLRQKDCCHKKIASAKGNARHSHQGSRASVLMWHRGEMARDFRSLLALRRHAQGPKHNARSLASLFLLISVTPTSQFLLTTRGRILVRYTNPAITGRKAPQRESSPAVAGFSHFYPPGRLSQA